MTVTGRVGHDEIPSRVARAHVVCQPSLIEPFGLALLEGMAAGGSVVATGRCPAEFVPPAAGSLVDPTDVDDIARGMHAAAALPRPNAAARAARRSTTSGRWIVWRRFSSEPLEIGQAALDERPDRLLEAGFARQLERLLVAPAHLLGGDALLQPVVAGDEELLDFLTNVLRLHKSHHNCENSYSSLWKLRRPAERDRRSRR